MRNFWIVTPCWKREEITLFVAKELKWVQEYCNGIININVVFIGNDENLNIAKKYDFHTVYTDNNFLGKKFNDGYEYAFKNGADAVVPIGSDSWVHPEVFIKTSQIQIKNTILYSKNHAMINEYGNKIGLIQSKPTNNNYNKCPLLFYPRDLMVKNNFRPCDERISRGCDRSTIENIVLKNKQVSFIKNNDINDVQYLAFKNKNVQIWQYSDYKLQFLKQLDNPFDYIEIYYPNEIAKLAKKYYESIK